MPERGKTWLLLWPEPSQWPETQFNQPLAHNALSALLNIIYLNLLIFHLQPVTLKYFMHTWMSQRKTFAVVQIKYQVVWNEVQECFERLMRKVFLCLILSGLLSSMVWKAHVMTGRWPGIRGCQPARIANSFPTSRSKTRREQNNKWSCVEEI